MKQTKTNSISKGIKIFFTFFIFSLACQQSFGQMLNGIIFQPMRILGESSTHVDVSGAIVRCDSTNQIHLKVFNESNISQVAVFELYVTNTTDGTHFSKSVSIPMMSPLQHIEGNCSGDSQLADLIINLPATYNPSNTTMNVNF